MSSFPQVHLRVRYASMIQSLQLHLLDVGESVELAVPDSDYHLARAVLSRHANQSKIKVKTRVLRPGCITIWRLDASTMRPRTVADIEPRVVPPFDKHLPIPARRGCGSRLGHDYSKMEVGDSFFVPNCDHHTLGSLCGNLRGNYGYTVSRRKEGNGIRVWRLA